MLPLLLSIRQFNFQSLKVFKQGTKSTFALIASSQDHQQRNKLTTWESNSSCRRWQSTLATSDWSVTSLLKARHGSKRRINWEETRSMEIRLTKQASGRFNFRKCISTSSLSPQQIWVSSSLHRRMRFWIKGFMMEQSWISWAHQISKVPTKVRQINIIVQTKIMNQRYLCLIIQLTFCIGVEQRQMYKAKELKELMSSFVMLLLFKQTSSHVLRKQVFSVVMLNLPKWY